MSSRRLLCALLVGTVVASPVVAAPPNSGGPSAYNFEDLYFDFELYSATPEFRWKLIWDLGNGATQSGGFFNSQLDAEHYAKSIMMYGLEPRGAIGYTVEWGEMEPKYELFWTFDKKSDALLFEQALQNLGEYTLIKRVSIFRNELTAEPEPRLPPDYMPFR